MHTDQRKNSEIDDLEMYKINNINDFIQKERRHDQLDRLNEVRRQKRVWLTVISLSATVNLLFLLIALIWG